MKQDTSRTNEKSISVFDQDQVELESIVDAFEDAWLSESSPEIAAFLPLDEPLRNRVLWELVQSDLELRVKCDEPASVESYCQSFPELQADRGRLVDLIRSEYRLRSKRNPGVRPQEYFDRFPDLADELDVLAESSNNWVVPERFQLRDDQPGIYQIDGDQMLVPEATNGRFRLLKMHAEGGLGKIWRAVDEELGRPVALKEIKSDQADDLESRKRFVLEALITGGLQHPSIVPVYRIGHHKDGRPFYTMRLVEGRTLGDAINEFHDTDWTKERPGAKNVELRRLLGNILDACDALNYAHQRGVVHRDIKPANIMLGDFGETLIVDWGLARMINRNQVEDFAPIDPLQLDEETQSMLISGTSGSPAFMSPEQARAESSQLNPATDIYSLGATLYALLTNQCPVMGSDATEVMENVKQGNWRRARQIDRQIPGALEAITMKSMAHEPAARYANLRELASDLEHYLADEPVKSHRESWLEQSARVGRRHRTWVQAAMAMVACLAIVATCSALMINKQRQRAIQSSGVKQGVLDFLVHAFRSPDPYRDGRSITVAEVLDKATEQLDRGDLSESPLEEATLRLALAETQSGLGLFKESEVNATKAANKFREAGFDRSAEVYESNDELVGALIALGKTKEAVAKAEENLAACTRDLPPNHPITFSAKATLAHTYNHLGEFDSALDLYSQSIDARTKFLGADHAETLKLRLKMTTALIAAGKHEQAIEQTSETHAVCLEKLGPDSLITIDATHNLAWAYKAAADSKARNSEDYELQDPLYRKAIELYEQALAGRRNVLGDRHFQTISAINNLAIAHRSLDHVEGESHLARASELLEEGLSTTEELAGCDHPLYLKMLNTLALVRMSSGDFAGAVPLLEELLPQIKEKFGENHPNVSALLGSLAVACERSGQQEKADELKEEVERRASIRRRAK